MLPNNLTAELFFDTNLVMTKMVKTPMTNANVFDQIVYKVDVLQAYFKTGLYAGAWLCRFLYEYSTPNSVAKCPYFHNGVFKINDVTIFTWDPLVHTCLLWIPNSQLVTIPASAAVFPTVNSLGNLVMQSQPVVLGKFFLVSSLPTSTQSSGFAASLKNAYGYVFVLLNN